MLTRSVATFRRDRHLAPRDARTFGVAVLAFSAMWQLDSYPLAEEIGDPDLFVGREKEMKRLLKWAEGTRLRRSKSMAGFEASGGL